MVSFNTILDGFEELRKREYLPREYVVFHEDLRREQALVRDDLREHTLLNDILLKDMQTKLEGGVHILDIEALQYPEDRLAVLFHRICELIRKHGQWDAAHVENLLSSVEMNRFSIQTLVTRTALKDTRYFESLAETVGIEMGTLFYIGLQVGKPFFEVLAEKIEKNLDLAEWKEGLCPVCGQEPAIAKLHGEEGRRMLHCCLCNTDWYFPRLQCPFCLNDDQKTLRFFFFEEEGPYRVDVCEKCKRYVKTVDERKMGTAETLPLEVEHIGTIFLDIMATNEGYDGPQCGMSISENETQPS